MALTALYKDIDSVNTADNDMSHSRYTYFGAVLLFAANIAFADKDEEIKKYIEAGLDIFKKCKSEHNLSDEIGLKILATIKQYDPLPESPEAKCFMSCQLQTAGEMSKDGAVDWDRVLGPKSAIYSAEDYQKIVQVVDICRKSEKKMEDVCQKAFDSAKCFYENVKKLNVAPLKIDI